MKNNNTESYTRTVNYAKRIGAKVVCFTSVAGEKMINEAYLHLLELQGYYQTNFNNWQPIEMKVGSAVKIGILLNQLSQFLKKEQVDYIIADSVFLDDLFIKDIIKEIPNKPIIINWY